MVDMTKTPLVMLRTLLMAENSLESIPADKISFENPTVVVNATPENITIDGKQHTITRNTQAIARIKGVEGLIDSSVPVKYERISLANLFGLCNPMIREVDIKDSGNVSTALVIAEILRKYKVNALEADFNYVLAQNEITLTAKDTNLSYLDSIKINVEQSLLSRILITNLNGFELWNGGSVPEPVIDYGKLAGTEKYKFTMLDSKFPLSVPRDSGYLSAVGGIKDGNFVALHGIDKMVMPVGKVVLTDDEYMIGNLIYNKTECALYSLSGDDASNMTLEKWKGPELPKGTVLTRCFVDSGEYGMVSSIMLTNADFTVCISCDSMAIDTTYKLVTLDVSKLTADEVKAFRSSQHCSFLVDYGDEAGYPIIAGKGGIFICKHYVVSKLNATLDGEVISVGPADRNHIVAMTDNGKTYVICTDDSKTVFAGTAGAIKPYVVAYDVDNKYFVFAGHDGVATAAYDLAKPAEFKQVNYQLPKDVTVDYWTSYAQEPQMGTGVVGISKDREHVTVFGTIQSRMG